MFKQPKAKPYTIPGLYALFVLLLVLSLFLYGYNYYSAWLTNQKNALTELSSNIEQKIKSYRYYSSSLFRIANNSPVTKQETNIIAPHKVRNDVYWMEGRDQTVDAILFGRPSAENISIAHRFSDYIAIIWAAQNNFNSMYYLNGLDNSLLLVTSHAALKPELRYRETYLTTSADDKRNEMLAESTALDEREALSNIQRFDNEDSYYFTYRAMFNNPGQLTSILAFDISVNSLASGNLSLHELTIQPSESRESNGTIGNIDSHINGLALSLTQKLPDIPYQLVYQVSLTTLIKELLYTNIWLIISVLLFITLSIGGIFFLRNRFISPLNELYTKLNNEQIINNEIVTQLPVGLVIYNFTTNEKLASNKIADQLLPMADLSKARDMAKEHQGRIQTSISNVVYEIVLSLLPGMTDTYLILFINKDKEALATRRLQLSQREYNKNVKARQTILLNIKDELLEPIKLIGHDIYLLCNHVNDLKSKPLLQRITTQSEFISEWVDNIALLVKLEAGDWKPTADEFLLSQVVDDIVKKSYPLMNNKGIELYYHNDISKQLSYIADGPIISKIILLLLNYAISNLHYGKIVIHLNRMIKQDSNKIRFSVIASGSGLSNDELINLHEPFMTKTKHNKNMNNSGMAFYLCDLLCKNIKGQLRITSNSDIGVSYLFDFPADVVDDNIEPIRILEDVSFKLDIINPEINVIIKSILLENGASLFNQNKSNSQDDFDFLVTDNNVQSQHPTLLLSKDSSNIEIISNTLIKCNYNFEDIILLAISQLIEQNIVPDDFNSINEYQLSTINFSDNLENLILNDYILKLSDSTYKDLFRSTVPDDINKMYTEFKLNELESLSLTVHRLKGVFAMLDFEFLKQICEKLELNITDKNHSQIEKGISQIDSLVDKLLLQGNE